MTSRRRITLSEEFKKNKDLKQEELNNLKEWCSKQPHLPDFPDELLVLFFHSCYFSIEFTKTTIDNYFTCRQHVPEFFNKRDPIKTDTDKNGKKVTGYVMLPPTPEGYRVCFIRLVNTEPSAYIFAEACKSFTMFTDLDLCWNGTAPGYVIVMDMAGIVFAHFPKLNIITMSKILYYLQQAMPVRLKGLHFINVVPFMDKVLAMMRPFLKKELMQVMHLHTDNVDTLYKFVPKRNLPRDYGGEAPYFLDLHEQEVRELELWSDWFLDEAKHRADESKRPGKARNAGDLFGIEGSFKKLDID